MSVTIQVNVIITQGICVIYIITCSQRYQICLCKLLPAYGATQSYCMFVKHITHRLMCYDRDAKKGLLTIMTSSSARNTKMSSRNKVSSKTSYISIVNLLTSDEFF